MFVCLFVIINNFFPPFRGKNCIASAVIRRENVTVMKSCCVFLEVAPTTKLGDLRTVNLDWVKEPSKNNQTAVNRG